MRTPLLLVLLLGVLGGLAWMLLGEGDSGDDALPTDLQAPEEGAASVEPRAPRVLESKERPVEIIRIDEIPEDVLTLLEREGRSILDDPEILNEIVTFEVDPRNPRFLRGEDLLRGIDSLGISDKPIKFLKREDLDKFRAHIFAVVVEPRVDAGLLISMCPLLGFRPVAYEGEVYMVPHDGFREESAPVGEDANPPGGTPSEPAAMGGG